MASPAAGERLSRTAEAPQPAEADRLPRHVAIIMDGNGRWAEMRGLPRSLGHKQGAEAVREAVEGAIEIGISYLTLYAFSSENWKRPAGEVSDLMNLLRLYIRRELADLHRNGVRVRIIGDRTGLAADIIGLIEEAESKTAANQRLNLVIALNYGAQSEIVTACRNIAEDVREGRIAAVDINEQMIAARLQTTGIPDPDLVIRTSGERRLSNFLLWQSAYAELLFIDTLWPDFTRRHLADAVNDYAKRERRYGGRNS